MPGHHAMDLHAVDRYLTIDADLHIHAMPAAQMCQKLGWDRAGGRGFFVWTSSLPRRCMQPLAAALVPSVDFLVAYICRHMPAGHGLDLDKIFLAQNLSSSGSREPIELRLAKLSSRAWERRISTEARLGRGALLTTGQFRPVPETCIA
jgi:hypothetical protein